MSFRLYVDDFRPAPTGWVLARNADEAKRFIETGNVSYLSLDHDLGPQSETGMAIVRFCVDGAYWPAKVTFHTMNPVGLANMKSLFLRYGPYRVSNHRELVIVKV